MRATLVISVLLAVVSTAMVAVCEHTEICRLRYRLWEVERRRDSLERQLRELDAKVAENETPRRLLDGDGASAQAVEIQLQAAPRRPRTGSAARPGGPADLRWFEEMDR